jgi:hypothetical protein
MSPLYWSRRKKDSPGVTLKVHAFYIEVLIVVIMVVKGTTTIADSTMGMLPVMHLIGI